jgi:two-component system sensor histidine kinase RegB
MSRSLREKTSPRGPSFGPLSLTHSSQPWRQRFEVNAPWLIRLRWVAVVGQLLTIGAVWLVLGIKLPIPSLLSVLAITSVSNLIFGGWVLTRSRKAFRPQTVQREAYILTAVMTLDLILLSALLYFSGGPTNPFAVFFFVNLSLCAFVLQRGAAWGLNLLAILCFGFLLLTYHPLPILETTSALAPILETGTVSLPQWGLLLAFIACGSVIVHFTSRLHDEVRHQESELRHAESQRARSEKLEALGTLAAGAAHELATPLSTIAVVAREFEKQLSKAKVSADWLEDVGLIRSELDRCRAILDQMSSDAGLSVGEAIQPATGHQLMEEVLQGLGSRSQVKAQVPESLTQVTLAVPVRGLAQAIRGLVKNALDASPNGVSVLFDGMVEDEELILTIRDRGPGMSAEVLRRLSEPFFTTKEPGEGMGLGVFLARTTIERLGGSLQVESAVAQGTTVHIRLPVQTAR